MSKKNDQIKPILHVSFVDDALTEDKNRRAAAFDDLLVMEAVGGHFLHLRFESFRVFDLQNVIFPQVRDYAGIIIGGSGHFVREADQLPWMRSMMLFIRQAVEANVPLLGICFGHQLIAHALGGVVGPFRDDHRDFGVVRMGRTKHADQHILFHGVPIVFDALASHGDHVYELPVGARILARSAICNVEAAEFGPATYGVQFHPEYTPEVMLDLARERIADEVSRNRFAAGLSHTPHATQVLKNFVKYVTEKEAFIS